MLIKIADRGTFLSTRLLGREVRTGIDEGLGQLGEGEGLVIDFGGVAACTYSFADEVVGTLVGDRAGGRFLDHGLVVVGFNPDVQETLELVMHRRHQAVFALLPGGEPTVLGAEPWLTETVRRALEVGEFRAADLAATLDISSQAMNNRLKAAMTAGAVTRERMVPEGGGKEFVYRPVQVPIPA